MLVEQSYGLAFFLKSSKNEKIGHIYVRITVDVIEDLPFYYINQIA